MRVRTTIILLLIAAVVGLLIAVSEFWWTPDPSGEEADRKKLFKLRKEDVTAIVVKGSGGSVTFRRSETGGAGWVLESPYAPADPYEIQCILDILTNLKEEGRVKAAEITGRSEAEFGLDEPMLLVEVKTAKESWRLAIGSESAVADRVYARTGDDPDIVIIGKGIVSAFSKSASQFRDRRVARFESYKLLAAEFHTPASVVKLERKRNLWKVTFPYEDDADMAMLENIFRTLQECTVERFESDGLDEADFAPFGVGRDSWKSARVVLRLADRAEPVEIFFGDAATDAPDLVFARNALFPSVYAVKAQILEVLRTPPGAFRSRAVFSFKPDDVWKVQIRNMKVLAEAEKMLIVGWLPRQPIDYNFDGNRVNSFLEKLATLQALEVVAEKVDDPEVFGLLVPTYTVTVSLEEKVAEPPRDDRESQGIPAFRKREEILRVGIVEDRVFGQREGQAKVVRLPRAFADMLSRAHLNFMGLRINEIFSTDIASVEFTMGNKFLRACQEEDGRWTVAEARNMRTPKYGIEEAVRVFRSLAAADIIADRIQLPCAWLDAPYLVVEATLRSEPPIATPKKRKLIISTKEAGDGRHLACIEGEDFVYVLEEGAVVAMAMPLTGH